MTGPKTGGQVNMLDRLSPLAVRLSQFCKRPTAAANPIARGLGYLGERVAGTNYRTLRRPVLDFPGPTTKGRQGDRRVECAECCGHRLPNLRRRNRG